MSDSDVQLALSAQYELVRVGNDQLIGEVIRLEGDNATIQASRTIPRHIGLGLAGQLVLAQLC